ncbi:lysophospholipid acyltransferase family protein [Candidatus Magnetominusculus dajiuhuensis]|uniref:lysophospholipid acyltransferase family protein n=1 Tax=Candidatus Magnetominusculus dajiuhuensis TaxID=3137712 RepID=UPI003B42B1FA
MKKKKRLRRIRWHFEYWAVRLIFLAAGALPIRAMHSIAAFLGTLLFIFVPKRRRIAVENIALAFPQMSPREVKETADKSAASFFLTFMEGIKYRSLLTANDPARLIRESYPELEALFIKAKDAHEKANGCIFVTPHIGNWEFLPYISSAVGIALVVVVRPLDNPYLEKLIYANRAESGQLFIAKTNAMFTLQETLRKGKSIGMLPDQSTAKGVAITYFGRTATATPIPAMLAVLYKRPIVVIACCRKWKEGGFTGYVSDPITPATGYESEKAEIIRLTQATAHTMEEIITQFPDQYLWMHNRWKTYKKQNLWAKDAVADKAGTMV